MDERLILSGFGGQGIMVLGQLLTYAGMHEGKEVSWLPSYGPEMRGGTANCMVMISDKPVGSPVVTSATSVMVLNKPSLIKFEDKVQPGGNLFINSSLIDIKATRTDINVYYVDCNNISLGLGNARGANMVMLGAYLQKVPVFTIAGIEETMKKMMTGKKAGFIPGNVAAIRAGMECPL